MPNPTHGARKRREILAAAADLSTADGLDALSFSQLAAEVGLTKAGVAAHFDSKEALQLAVVGSAAAAYGAPLEKAANSSEPGLPRLRALALAWFEHLDGIPYRGGCFFGAAGATFAGKPGPIRDAIAAQVRVFLSALEEQARLAKRLGELDRGVSPELLAFQVHALAQEANLRRELLDDDGAFETAERALVELLARGAKKTQPHQDAKRKSR